MVVLRVGAVAGGHETLRCGGWGGSQKRNGGGLISGEEQWWEALVW